MLVDDVEFSDHKFILLGVDTDMLNKNKSVKNGQFINYELLAVDNVWNEIMFSRNF